jgi:hypothetical protein
MTTISPNARALAARHDARLAIFRLLVKAGDDGLRVSDIGERLAPSTWRITPTLVDAAGAAGQQGREVFNWVDFPAMHRLVGFPTSECRRCCAALVGGCGEMHILFSCSETTAIPKIW